MFDQVGNENINTERLCSLILNDIVTVELNFALAIEIIFNNFAGKIIGNKNYSAIFRSQIFNSLGALQVAWRATVELLDELESA